MAMDIVALLKELGLGKIALVGHDRGARVATGFTKDHRALVDRLVVMDNVPMRVVAHEMDARIARAYWLFFFHLGPDFPEILIRDRVDLWLRHFFSDWCYVPLTISGEAFDTYVHAYRRPGAVCGAMVDYRANAEDVAQDQVDANPKIACPVLSLWGSDFEAVGRMFDMAAVWSKIAVNLRVEAIEQCCHLPHEEQPERVNGLLLEFLGWLERIVRLF